MTPRTTRRTPSPFVYGLLLLAPAAFALTIAMLLPSRQATAADPDRRDGVQRTLGIGGTFSNYTLQNNTGNFVTGMTFKFFNFAMSDILGTFTNKSTWYTNVSEISTGTAMVNTHIDWSTPVNVPSSTISHGQSGHFGYMMPAHLSHRTVDEASWSLSGTVVATYPKSVLDNYWKTPESTVTPSATPIAAPTATTGPLALHRSPQLLRLHVGSVSAGAPPGQRIRVQEDPAGDPAWAALHTRNNWRPMTGDNDGTILIQRSVKIIRYPQIPELAALIEDSDLVGGAELIDIEPIALKVDDSIVTYVGPLPEDARGALVYYTSRPEKPDPDRETSNSPHFTGYFAISLETDVPTLTPTPTPTPTPTRRGCYFPHVLRDHVLRPLATPTP